MRSVKALELLDRRVELYLLHDQRATRCKRLDFGSRKRYFTRVFGLTSDVLAVHDLIDKARLSVKDIPKARVKAALGNVGIFRYLVIHVFLSERAAVSLFNVARSPRSVKVVNRYDALLRVHTNTHLTGRTDQHTYLAIVHVFEELLFLRIGVRLVNKGDFLCGNAALT